jgi:hypothetical protein
VNGKKTTFPIITWYCLENPIAIGLLGYGAKTIGFNLSDLKPLKSLRTKNVSHNRN